MKKSVGVKSLKLSVEKLRTLEGAAQTKVAGGVIVGCGDVSMGGT